MRHWTPVFSMALSLTLAGCDKSGGDKPAPTTSTPAATIESSTPGPSAGSATVAPTMPTAELKISSTGTTMVFDVTTFEVKPGQPVHVVFENKAPGTVSHNWVLLAKPGVEASYAASVMDKVKQDFYADGPEVLAHVALAKPGEKTETTFTAPTKPGDYPYICSFPGHYVMMKGVLTVKP